MPKEKRHTRSAILITLASLFVFIGCIYLVYWFWWGRFEVFTDDAYVHGNIVRVMPRISGTVKTIYAKETQPVQVGQLLVKLDDADQRIAFALAKKKLALTVRQVQQYFHQVKERQSQLRLSEANLTEAKLDFERRSKLVRRKEISEEALQHYQTKLDTAEAEYKVAQDEYQSAKSYVEGTTISTHPLTLQAEEQLKKAYLDLARTEIMAPVTGIVAKREVQVGQEINIDSVLMAIIPLEQMWVNANFKESDLEHIRTGQPVSMYADAYSHVNFKGKVVGLSAGTGSAFSLLPPQNATGNWIKILQRLPVRISLNPETLRKYPLQIGLSMNVTIDISDQSKPRLKPIRKVKREYDTPIYQKQLKDIQLIIDRILKENNGSDNISTPGHTDE